MKFPAGSPEDLGSLDEHVLHARRTGFKIIDGNAPTMCGLLKGACVFLDLTAGRAGRDVYSRVTCPACKAKLAAQKLKRERDREYRAAIKLAKKRRDRAVHERREYRPRTWIYLDELGDFAPDFALLMDHLQCATPNDLATRIVKDYISSPEVRALCLRLRDAHLLALELTHDRLQLVEDAPSTQATRGLRRRLLDVLERARIDRIVSRTLK